MCLSIITCFSSGPWFDFFASLKDTHAITTPWGITYFIDNPSERIQSHEQCHYDRMVEVGAFNYYLDYIFGGACEEELRCGASRSHNACTKYPLSRIPPRGQGGNVWWTEISDLLVSLPHSQDQLVDELGD